jgi:hypothetical protein
MGVTTIGPPLSALHHPHMLNAHRDKDDMQSERQTIGFGSACRASAAGLSSYALAQTPPLCLTPTTPLGPGQTR